MSEKVRDDVTSAPVAGGETMAVNASDTDALIGQVIDGKYLVEALIGEGGMGKVYRGRNTRTESPVAIKTLIPDLLVDESLVERFKIEAKAASNLRHPNTIRVYDFGKEGDVLFMVMELLDGMSLEGLLQKEGRVEPGRLLNIIRQTCRSLDEAHSAGLVHRDIKPDNIFLNRVGDEEDQVKVLDFGVAKLQNNQYGNATLTQAGMIFGTPRYMAPEQARAMELSGRSDIYALGIIMYEALTGKPPFEANDPVGVLIKHVNEPPTPFAQMNPSMEPMPEFEAVVMRCMAKDPNDRFDDVRTLMNALDGVASAMGISGTGLTGPTPRGGQETMAVGGATQAAPARLRSEAFETFGVDGEVSGAAKKSRYTMGASRTDVPSGDHSGVGGSSPVLRIALALGALVLVAGVALVLLVGSGGDDGPTEETADAVAVADEDVTATPPAALIAPVVEVAEMRLGRAFDRAAEAAAARVVAIEVRATPAEAGALAQVEGMDGEPIALPHTFVFTRDPNSPPATVQFNITAEGYRDATHETPLAATDAPVVVELRRRSSGSSGSEGGVRVPPPRERDGDGRGFDDPYRR